MKPIVFIIALLIVSFAAALPTLEQGNSKPTEWKCSNYLENSKQFYPRTERIHVGLVCSNSAQLTLFECQDEQCEEQIEVARTFKLNGKLVTFGGFTQSKKYYYECRNCKDLSTNAPPKINFPNIVRVKEGDEVKLRGQCLDDDYTSLEVFGWMDSLTKQITYDDAGEHEVKLICTDEFFAQTIKTIRVVVADSNRAPVIISVKNRGKGFL